jgi:hypothetical protein
MGLQLDQGSLEFFWVVQVPDVLEEPVPQRDGRVDDCSMARGKRGAKEPVKAL